MSLVDELDSSEPKGKETAEGKKKRSHILILIGLGSLVLMYLMYKHSKTSTPAASTTANAPSPYGSAYGGTALPYSSGGSSGYGGIANALQQMQSQFTASQTASNTANATSQAQLSAEMAALQQAFAASTANHVGSTSTGGNAPIDWNNGGAQTYLVGSGGSNPVTMLVNNSPVTVPFSSLYASQTGNVATAAQAANPLNNISAGQTIRYTNPITGAVSPY